MFHLPKMLYELFFSPEVVKVSCWMKGFFPPESWRYPWRPCSWNPKKKMVTDTKKWCSTRLLRRSWSGSPNNPKKMTFRDRLGDLTSERWITLGGRWGGHRLWITCSSNTFAWWVGVWFGYGGCLIDIWVGTWDRDFHCGSWDFCFSFKNTSRGTVPREWPLPQVNVFFTT